MNDKEATAEAAAAGDEIVAATSGDDIQRSQQAGLR
jgi:hypothetical protein